MVRPLSPGTHLAIVCARSSVTAPKDLPANSQRRAWEGRRKRRGKTFSAETSTSVRSAFNAGQNVTLLFIEAISVAFGVGNNKKSRVCVNLRSNCRERWARSVYTKYQFPFWAAVNGQGCPTPLLAEVYLRPPGELDRPGPTMGSSFVGAP